MIYTIVACYILCIICFLGQVYRIKHDLAWYTDEDKTDVCNGFCGITERPSVLLFFALFGPMTVWCFILIKAWHLIQYLARVADSDEDRLELKDLDSDHVPDMSLEEMRKVKADKEHERWLRNL